MMKRILAAFLSLLMTVQPATVLWRLYAALGATVFQMTLLQRAQAADPPAITQAIQDGKSSGNTFLKSFPQSTTSNQTSPSTAQIDTTFNTPNGPLSQTNHTKGSNTSIFGQGADGHQDDTVSARGHYGDDTGWGSMIGDTAGRLGGEQSSQGEAYRLLHGGGPPLPKSQIDPQVLIKGSDAIKSPPFSDCSTSTTTTLNTRSATAYREEHCSKPNQPFSNCEVQRDMSIHAPISSQAAGLTVTMCGPNCYDMEHYTGWIDCGTENNNNDHPCDPRSMSWVFTVDTTTVAAARTWQECDDGCLINVNGTNVEMVGAFQETSTNHQSTDWTSITPYMAPNQPLTINWHEETYGGGSGRIKIHIESTQNLVEDRGLVDSPAGCLNFIRSNARCSGATWTCEHSEPTEILPGVFLTGANAPTYGATLQEIYPGEFANVGLCHQAKTVNACSYGGSTTIIDSNGNTVPVSATTADVMAAANACDQEKLNKGCTVLHQQCIAGAVDPTSGECTQFDVTYNCPIASAELPTGATTSTNITGCALRCMGTECLDPQDENNHDFGAASAAVQALDSIPMDSACDPATGCTIWKGEHLECKTILFGVQDCCRLDMSDAPGPLEYANFVYGTYDKAMKVGVISRDNIVNGSATAIKNYAGGAIDTITQPFKTAWDSMVATIKELPFGGGTVGDVSLNFSSFGLDPTAITAQVTEQLEAWATDIFGPAISSFVLGGGGSAAMNQVGPSLSSVMGDILTDISYAGWVVTAIQLYYKCEEPEIKLAQKNHVGACHSVGKYCAVTDPLGICIHEQSTFCCFGSLLSRLMQEQIRMQSVHGSVLDRSWGSPTVPDCGGLNLSEIAAADFKQVKLDEWLATLTASGALPTAHDIISGGMDKLTRNHTAGPNVTSANALDRVYGQAGTAPNTGINILNNAAETLKPSN